jgi:hypothetical protein
MENGVDSVRLNCMREVMSENYEWKDGQTE